MVNHGHKIFSLQAVKVPFFEKVDITTAHECTGGREMIPREFRYLELEFLLLFPL